MEGFLDGFEGLLAGLFFLGALLFVDEAFDMRFEGREGLDQRGVAVVLDDAAAGAGGEIEEGHIDEALDVAGGPGGVFQAGERR